MKTKKLAISKYHEHDNQIESKVINNASREQFKQLFRDLNKYTHSVVHLPLDDCNCQDWYD